MKPNLLNTHLKNNEMKFILEAILAFTLSLVMPVLPFIQAVFVVVVCDFVIGITAALYAREKFSWFKLSQFIAKLVVFGFFLVAIYQLQISLQLESLNIVGLVTGVIMVLEVKSIDKNIKKLFNISIWEIVSSKFGNQLQGFENSSEKEANAPNSDTDSEKKI